MHVFILGCGRVGARVASRLDGSHDVIVMDWNEAAFARLPDSFSGRAVLGNGIDVDALKKGGLQGCDAFIALTDGDNRNLMAGEIARALGIPKVIVRVYDPVRHEIFGGDEMRTISPTVEGARALFEMIAGTAEGA